nr:protein kintoun-like [Aegilops tauschii subsp. strangulata]
MATLEDLLHLQATIRGLIIQVMSTLKDLLHLLAVHGILCHLPPPCAPPNGPTGSTQGAHRPGDANPQRPPPPPGPTSSALRATPNGPTGRTQGAHHPGDYNPSTMTGRATTGDRDGPTAPLEAASPAQSSDDFVPRDPPRSSTKGRAKSRRYKSALELHPKKKNKCSQCQSTEHTAGVCPLRLL